MSGWASQAEAGGAKLLSELETGWLRIKLPQTVGGQEAGELGLRPGASASLSGQGQAVGLEALGLVDTGRKYQAEPNRVRR